MANPRSKSSVKTLFILAILAVAAGVIWMVLHRGGPEQPNSNNAIASQPGAPAVPPPPPQTQPAGNPEYGITAEQQVAAKQAYENGLTVLRGGSDADKVNARRLLSEVLAGGKLPDDLAAECRRHLTELAADIVFSKKIFTDDPHTQKYVVQPGDILLNIAKVQKVKVPWQGIARINGLEGQGIIRPGQVLKLVRGPFNAIITKHSFTLDLYQQGMFVKTYRVGLGANGSTPAGKWRVSPGRRMTQAPWTTPDNKVIRHGTEGYPLGKEGYWVALDGIDANTRNFSGLGIHGTDEPQSIGKQASAGCVRLADEDIAEVWAFLYDGQDEQSQVEVRP